MQIKKLLFWTFVLALLVAGGLWLRTQVRIDICLDRGGRWNKERQMCEGAASWNHRSKVCNRNTVIPALILAASAEDGAACRVP
jgi:hypothetical protein